MKKLNEQIRASKFTKPEEKRRIHSTNDSRKEDRRDAAGERRDQRGEARGGGRQAGDESTDYLQVFAAKPKIPRSPPGTPEKPNRI